MVALIFDGDLLSGLKEGDRLGLQQHRGTEGVAERRRPERIESPNGVLRLFLHVGRTPRREKRTLVIADIGVGAEILAIGIDASLVMDIAVKIIDRLGSVRRRDELEIVGVEPWAQEIRNVGLSLGCGRGWCAKHRQEGDGQSADSAFPRAFDHQAFSSLKNPFSSLWEIYPKRRLQVDVGRPR